MAGVGPSALLLSFDTSMMYYEFNSYSMMYYEFKNEKVVNYGIKYIK